MSRDIFAEFDKAEIGITSATYDIVGLPPVRLVRTASPTRIFLYAAHGHLR